MDWLLIVILYIVAAAMLFFEGQTRMIGGINALFVSLLLTPVIAVFVVSLSRKRINFRHYVKLNNEDIADKSLRKTLHKNGSEKWVEIKTSELRII